MAHKVLVGGTKYDVVSGKSMVSGTSYKVSKGKVNVNGTTYSIKFTRDPTATGDPTAMLYSDGSMVFQLGSNVASGKTLTASYTGFDDVNYEGYANVPWNSQRANITSVTFQDETSPISLAYWFNYCKNITAINHSKLNWNGITNMCYAFYECCNMPSQPVCGANVTNMSYAYYHCTNLTGSPVCGNKVTNMRNAYYNCYNLTGRPVCSNNVVQFSGSYCNCTNLTGSPVCGSAVTNMDNTYAACKNLTGSPVCGANVTSMTSAYQGCFKLTGAPLCGNKVVNMTNTYFNCTNLTGPAVLGVAVVNAARTYHNCKNLSGNAYFYGANITNLLACFWNKNNAKRLNIYVPSGSKTNTRIHYNNTTSIVAQAITWTDEGTYQYNATYNIYIYPVSNVAASRAANGD